MVAYVKGESRADLVQESPVFQGVTSRSANNDGSMQPAIKNWLVTFTTGM